MKNFTISEVKKCQLFQVDSEKVEALELMLQTYVGYLNNNLEIKMDQKQAGKWI